MTVDAKILTPDLALDQLERACDEAKETLEKLAHQLAKRWAKRLLIGRTTRAVIQHQIMRVSQIMTGVAQAAQAVRSTPQPKALRQLEAAIKTLEAEKVSLQKHLSPPLKASLLDNVVSLLTPVTVTVWGVFFKIGVLVTAAFWVVGVPLVIGTLILLKKTYRQIKCLLVQTQVEDRTALVEQITLIIHSFEKVEEKMHASETMALRQTAEKNTAETMALRQTAEKNTAETLTLRRDVEELKETNAELKKMVEKLLEIQGKKPPSS